MLVRAKEKGGRNPIATGSPANSYCSMVPPAALKGHCRERRRTVAKWGAPLRQLVSLGEEQLGLPGAGTPVAGGLEAEESRAPD